MIESDFTFTDNMEDFLVNKEVIDWLSEQNFGADLRPFSTLVELVIGERNYNNVLKSQNGLELNSNKMLNVVVVVFYLI